MKKTKKASQKKKSKAPKKKKATLYDQIAALSDVVADLRTRVVALEICINMLANKPAPYDLHRPPDPVWPTNPGPNWTPNPWHPHQSAETICEPIYAERRVPPRGS